MNPSGPGAFSAGILITTFLISSCSKGLSSSARSWAWYPKLAQFRPCVLSYGVPNNWKKWLYIISSFCWCSLVCPWAVVSVGMCSRRFLLFAWSINSLVHASPLRIHVNRECCIARAHGIVTKPTDLAFRYLRNSSSSVVSALCSCAASSSSSASFAMASRSARFPKFCHLHNLRAFAVLISFTWRRRMASCVLTGWVYASCTVAMNLGMVT